MTRQIITAIKTATRFKHAPLNQYVSFSHTPAGQDATTTARSATRCPGRASNDPSVCVISTAGAAERSSAASATGAVAARVGCAAPLPRRLVVRADGGGARLRHEDDRQCAAAREAQDPHAPTGPPGSSVDVDLSQLRSPRLSGFSCADRSAADRPGTCHTTSPPDRRSARDRPRQARDKKRRKTIPRGSHARHLGIRVVGVMAAHRQEDSAPLGDDQSCTAPFAVGGRRP